MANSGHVSLGTVYTNYIGRQLKPLHVGRAGDRIVVVAEDQKDGSRHAVAVSVFLRAFHVTPPCFFCELTDGHRDNCPAVA